MNKQTLYKAEREQAEVRLLLRQTEDAEYQAWCKRYREVQTIKTDKGLRERVELLEDELEWMRGRRSQDDPLQR